MKGEFDSKHRRALFCSYGAKPIESLDPETAGLLDAGIVLTNGVPGVRLAKTSMAGMMFQPPSPYKSSDIERCVVRTGTHPCRYCGNQLFIDCDPSRTEQRDGSGSYIRASAMQAKINELTLTYAGPHRAATSLGPAWMGKYVRHAPAFMRRNGFVHKVFGPPTSNRRPGPRINSVECPARLAHFHPKTSRSELVQRIVLLATEERMKQLARKT